MLHKSQAQDTAACPSVSLTKVQCTEGVAEVCVKGGNADSILPGWGKKQPQRGTDSWERQRPVTKSNVPRQRQGKKTAQYVESQQMKQMFESINWNKSKNWWNMSIWLKDLLGGKKDIKYHRLTEFKTGCNLRWCYNRKEHWRETKGRKREIK